jgi:hypothetical protein
MAPLVLLSFFKVDYINYINVFPFYVILFLSECGSSLSVSNGNVTFTITTYGSNASLVCDTGYETNKASLGCLDTGSWETSTCTIKGISLSNR